MKFDDIVAHGNRGFHRQPVTGTQEAFEKSRIVCADGYTMSVIAGAGTYCAPLPALCSCGLGATEVPLAPSDWYGAAHDYAGPYTEVEVGFPIDRPEPWDIWRDYAESPYTPTRSVYGYVPVDVVRDLIALHGGERGPRTVREEGVEPSQMSPSTGF